MEYAIIKDGIVINVVVWDGVSEWQPPEETTLENINVLLPQPGIGWNYDGISFTAPPTPEKTYEELIEEAEIQKQNLIGQANAYLGSKQWPGKAVLGRLTDTEKEKYNLWLDYLDALEAVDTSSAPDINWPTAPASEEG